MRIRKKNLNICEVKTIRRIEQQELIDNNVITIFLIRFRDCCTLETKIVSDLQWRILVFSLPAIEAGTVTMEHYKKTEIGNCEK